ncbi:MAG: RNA polymerase sigma factor [Candidatus Ozemobacteraceae bacterium]
MHDLEIVGQVLRGRKDEFRLLMDRYSGLCRYYYEKRWGFDTETALDLTQELFLKAFRNLHSLIPGSSFKAWLMTIARNLAIDHHRKKGRKEEEERSFIDVPGESPEQTALKIMLVREVLDKIPARQREAMELRYVWDLTSAEIGKIMNLPEGTVRSDLYYARIRLLELLETDESL